MTDTDSDMMRRQQNMDTPQTIEDGPFRGKADLDERDGADRRRASGNAPSEGNGQDAVFAQNARGRAKSERSVPPSASSRRLGGLVRRGRSLLGS